MKKRKRMLLIILGIIAIVAAIGGSFAAFVASTVTKEGISTGELDIAILQKQDEKAEGVKALAADGKNKAGYAYDGMPGDTVEEQVAVQNTAGKDAYVRVTVNRSFQDAAGKKNFELSPTAIELNAANSDWFVVPDASDDEVIYYYYKHVLKSGETTANVMDSFSILKNTDGSNSNAYSGFKSAITFEAEGLQTMAAKDAMLAEWGIVATIDQGTGDLIAYTEQ